MRSRMGFTMAEVAIVIVLIGLLAAFAYPRLAPARESAALNAAKRHLITQLGAARATAVQRGRAVALHTDGTDIWLTTAVGGVETEIGPRAKVYDQFETKIEASHDPVVFDSRGFSTSLPLAGGKFLLHRAERTDSVCVSRFGTIVQECGL